MKDHSLIADMREKVKSQNEYDKFAALLFALQIPSICSRIEIPRTEENSGKPNEAKTNPGKVLYNEKTGAPFDKNLYFAWLKRHQRAFIQFFFRLMPFETLCEAIYDLRNSVTHSGNLLELDSRIVLLESDSYGGFFSGRILYMSLSKFCNTMFDAAKGVFSGDAIVVENLILHTFPDVCFDIIEKEYERKYRAFWAGRDEDLRLYQIYCFNMLGRLTEIEQHMEDVPGWSIDGLTRAELERLVDVVYECDVFGDAFDAEIAKTYFT